MIRSLIVETYGGKIDDEGDFRQLEKLVQNSMVPQAYDEDYKLVNGTEAEQEDSLEVPGGTSLATFTEWVRQLPEREPPTFLGLPANAEKLLLVDQGNTMIKNLARVAEVLDEGERVMAEAAASA
jgi:dynein heavy chain 1